MRALLEQLGRNHQHYTDALVYQQRLVENLTAKRRYGDTETRQAERAEIIAYLNTLAQETLDITFNAYAPHPDLAVKFIQFLVGPEGQAIMAESQHPMILPPIADNKESLPEMLQPLVE